VRFFAAILLLAGAAAHAGPKHYVFDCGMLYLDDVTPFGLAAEETPVRELFVPCYLVRHAKGLLFWDGGLPLSVATLWIAHDKALADTLRKAPAYYQ